MLFLSNCPPEVLDTLHNSHCNVLCKRLEHYLQTHNKKKLDEITKVMLEEDLRYYELKKDK